MCRMGSPDSELAVIPRSVLRTRTSTSTGRPPWEVSTVASTIQGAAVMRTLSMPVTSTMARVMFIRTA
jgi:hypothetical protein